MPEKQPVRRLTQRTIVRHCQSSQTITGKERRAATRLTLCIQYGTMYEQPTECETIFHFLRAVPIEQQKRVG